jgi:hypothetical protein
VTNEEMAIALGVLVVTVIIAVLLLLERRSNKGRPKRLPPIEIARIVESGVVHNTGAGGIGLFLLIFSAISVLKYFAAETVNQQIVALLLWIGNGVFWGSLMLVATISRGKTSTVYRDQAPAERQDPLL